MLIYVVVFVKLHTTVKAAGEKAKDDHYLETVRLSDHGDEFIPLVCESFGVWTPFALSTLFIIAAGQLENSSLIYICTSSYYFTCKYRKSW